MKVGTLLALVLLVGCRGLTDKEQAIAAARADSTMKADALADSVKKEVDGRKFANNIVGRISYVRDPRGTDLCYAFLWMGAASGGPALASISCRSVPPELLLTADMPVPNPPRDVIP